MTFESKHALGERFILAGCPCVIASVEFKDGSEETYKVQWVNPFTKSTSYMSRTELDNCIAISGFLSKHNGSGNESESLNAYDSVVMEWANSAKRADDNNSDCDAS